MPILKEIGEGRLQIVGTGFYISRYGLFMTARHVVEALVDDRRSQLGVAFIMHPAEGKSIHLRRIRTVNFLDSGADVAVGQADNYVHDFPDQPLQNLRARLSTEIPATGSPVVTYAYPGNETLDFTSDDNIPTVSSDYYDGEFLGYITDPTNPFMPYPHFETSIEVRGGASGGPVFSEGRVIGVNCRGWDFDGAEHEGDQLSSIVPVGQTLDLKVTLTQLPKISWEYEQIPEDLRGSALTIAELATFGHILL